MDRRVESLRGQETQLLTSREAGLRRLDAFVPRMRQYAGERGFDRPLHKNVSQLSVYLKHRLILESEAVGAALRHYPVRQVEKFLQEVIWRSYWKGWLEWHPGVWERYLQEVDKDQHQISGSQLADWEAATRGETNIDCFNHWAQELLDTGYLHNHARMWFASIWIFTLRLPWSLGAAFFLSHLHDGDAASNTLSWRWVAGLHTRGKRYLALASNIKEFTEGRFDPAGQLSKDAPEPVEEAPPEKVPLTRRLPPDLRTSAGLLLTPDDLTPELSELRDAPFTSIAGGWSSSVSTRLRLSSSVIATGRAATRDALARASEHFGAPVRQLAEDSWVDAVTDWAASNALERVLALETPVGPWRTELRLARDRLAQEGIELQEVRRSWDDCLWPYASAGYFRFKHKAWPYLNELAAIQP